MEKKILITLFIILWPMRNAQDMKAVREAKLMRDYCELDLIAKDKTGTLVETLSNYCKRRYQSYLKRKDKRAVSVELEEATKFDKYMKALLAHEEKLPNGFDKTLRQQLYTDDWPNYYETDQRDGRWLQAHYFYHELREWMVMGGKTRFRRKLSAKEMQEQEEEALRWEREQWKRDEEKYRGRKATALEVKTGIGIAGAATKLGVAPNGALQLTQDNGTLHMLS